MEEHQARSHLKQLADELASRDWHAVVCQVRRGVVLEVTNPEVSSPDEPPLRETITCEDTGDGEFAYSFVGGQLIGQVVDVPAAADQIQHVLRSVGT
jgi:hypothetical protein